MVERIEKHLKATKDFRDGLKKKNKAEKVAA